MNMYRRPIGWRNESYRHYLAAKGVKTRFYSPKYEVTIPEGFTEDEQKRVKLKIKNMIERHKDEAFNRRLHEERESFSDDRRKESKSGGTGHPVDRSYDSKLLPYVFTPAPMRVEQVRKEYEDKKRFGEKIDYVQKIRDESAAERDDKYHAASGIWMFSVKRPGDAGSVLIMVENQPDYVGAKYEVLEKSYRPSQQAIWDEELDKANESALEYWKSLVAKGEGNEYTPKHIAEMEAHIARVKREEAMARPEEQEVGE